MAIYGIAQADVMRAHAFRSGYPTGAWFVTVAGTNRTSAVIDGSLTITDQLNDTPNRLSLTMRGVQPTKGQVVVATLGSVNNSRKLFAGHILTVTQRDIGRLATPEWDVAAVDYTWLLQGHFVWKTYTSQSATDILHDLIDTYAPSGFTRASVAAGLDTIDEITFTAEDLPTCLSRVLGRIGGYWYVDYAKDVHAWAGTETGTFTQPTALLHSGYATLVQADAPEGYWRLEETSNTTAADTSGNGHAGTYTTGPTLGQPGGLANGNLGIALDGTADMGVSVSSFAVTAAVTIEALIKLNGAQVNHVRVFSSNSTLSYPIELGIAVSGGVNSLACFLNFVTVGDTGWLDSGVVLDDGVWYHVAVTWDGTDIVMYVDGVAIYTNSSWSGNVLINVGSSTGVRTWGYTGGGASLDGALDECAYYDAALTPSQLAAHAARVLSLDHRSFDDLSDVTDLSQTVTRILIEGYGSTARSAVDVGDTTIPIEAGAFYESSGGSVVAGSQILTYTGLGVGMTSSATWVSGTPAESASWTSVVYADALGLFVAVGLSGRVMTSPDGVSWTSRTAAEANNWVSICWSSGLGLLVAVAYSGTNRVMTSSDGTTWTARAAAEANTWRSVCWADDLGLFVAVASTGTHRVMTSSDGTTWNTASASAARLWWGVTWAKSLGLLVAVADDTTDTTTVMTSTDGSSWTSRTSPNNSALFAVTWSPTLALFVASKTAGVHTSSDGTTWTSRSIAAASDLQTVLWADGIGKFIALSFTSLTTNVIVSSDGLTWQTEAAPIDGQWRGLAWNGTDGLVVAVGYSSGSSQVMTSTAAEVHATLTGIPASGTGAVLYAIAAGEDVNILETVNDTTAQTALVTLIGGDGIVSEYVQDRRLSKTECQARGAAILALKKSAVESVRYTSRDIHTRSGRTIVIDLGAPTSIAATLRIQDVTISDFSQASGRMPTYHVEASTIRFSFEDLLRLARKGTGQEAA